jgi:hypothetical protein
MQADADFDGSDTHLAGEPSRSAGDPAISPAPATDDDQVLI